MGHKLAHEQRAETAMQQYSQSALEGMCSCVHAVAHAWSRAHCVSSCTYTTNWNLLLNSCLFRTTHAVNTPSIWPNQCAAVVRRLVIVCVSLLSTGAAFKVIWEKPAGSLHTKTNNWEVSKYCSYFETCHCCCLVCEHTHHTLISCSR